MKQLRKERGKLPDYTPEQIQDLVLEICSRHADGQTIREIFRSPEFKEITNLSRGTLYKWLESDKDLQDQYRRAREMFADEKHDKMLELAEGAKDIKISDQWTKKVDPAGVKATELEINTIQWIIGRAHSKKYGAKVEDEGPKENTNLPNIETEVQPKRSEPLK